VTRIEVPLSRGFVALVDPADVDSVLQHKWSVHRERTKTYAVRNVRRADGSRTTQKLHTFLTGWPFVDHINGDGLDNTRSNLRQATNAENLHNRGPQSNNTSGYKGVYWNKQAGKWHAQIRAHRKAHFLGHHDTAEAAARAYDEAAVRLHGEFAHLNFPEGVR
jgi:hypothetical protein